MSDPTHRKEVRSEILKNLHPVRPLREPWKRVGLTLVPWAMVAIAFVWVALGLRADLEEVGVLWSWGVSGFFLLSAATVAVFAVRESIPATSTPRVFSYGLISALLGAQIVVAAALNWRHPFPVDEAAHLSLAFVCSSAICGFALLWAVSLVYLISRGLTARWVSTATLVGAASVLAAEAVWRIHCPYTSTSHLLMAHFPPYLLVFALGLLVSVFRRRRRREL